MKSALGRIMCIIITTLFIVSLSSSILLSAYDDNNGSGYVEDEDIEILCFYELPIIEVDWYELDGWHDEKSDSISSIMPINATPVLTLSITHPTNTTARLSATINIPSGMTITSVGFWIRRSDQTDIRQAPASLAEALTMGSFETVVGNFTTGHRYYVRSIAREPGMGPTHAHQSGAQSFILQSATPTPPPGGGTPTPTPPPGGSTPTPPPGGGTPTPAPPTPTPAPSFSFNPSHMAPWNTAPWRPSAIESSTTTTVIATQSWSWSQSSGSEGWLTVTGSGAPGSQLTLRVLRNDTGERREATVTVRSGSLPPQVLDVSQAPVMATMRGQRVIECYGRRGYVDVHGVTETLIFGGIGGAIVERPVWNFVHIEGNIFAIRNDTTGRYFTETNGDLRHESRISGSGTNYSNNQRWLISPQPNGTYRIRSVSNTTLYVTDGMLVLTLSSQNTSNNSQLWRIGYIWHVAASYDHDPNVGNWVGFWRPGDINIMVTPIGAQPDGFNLTDRMDIARDAWVHALGISFDTVHDRTLANIRVYGGNRSEIQDRIRREVPFDFFDQLFGAASPTAGVRSPIDGYHATIQAGGATRRVYRLVGTGANGMIMAIFTDDGGRRTYSSRNIDFATMTAMHELGHSLGYMGHSPNSSDVMLANVPSSMRTPNERLNPAEIEHLRQIYRDFRR